MITSARVTLTPALRAAIAACADAGTPPLVAVYEPGSAITAWCEGIDACAVSVRHRGEECAPGVYCDGAGLSEAEAARVSAVFKEATSATLDAAAALAVANLAAAEARVTALLAVLRLMVELDDAGTDAALTAEERGMVDGLLPGAAYVAWNAKIAAAQASLPALEAAVDALAAAYLVARGLGLGPAEPTTPDPDACPARHDPSRVCAYCEDPAPGVWHMRHKVDGSTTVPLCEWCCMNCDVDTMRIKLAVDAARKRAAS